MTGCRQGRSLGEGRGVAQASWILSILLAASAVAWTAAAPAAAEEAHDFAVAAGSADEVVSAIADASGDFILYRYDALRGVRSGGVVGRFTAIEALERALEGTGFAARLTPGGAIVVEAASPHAAPSDPDRTGRRESRNRAEVEPRPELLIVTGTRIRRTGMNTPVPVTVMSGEEMARLSPTTLISGIDQLPQFVNNATPDYAVGISGSVGQSFLNLRGIGSNRTLILLDGRRVVASTRRGTTDIGILPEALVEDVEIITGGASATYGSDAVAGVVNFRLDTDFEGVRGHLQGGMSERGDYEHGELSLAAGFSLDPRTHLLLAADAFRTEGVDDVGEREWHRSWGLVRGVPANNDPRFIIAPNVVASSYSYGGLIPSGPLRGTQFLPNGQAAPFDYGVYSGPSTQIGGSGVDPAKERVLVPSSERQSAFAYLSRDLSPDFAVYLQALYGRTASAYDKDPNYMSSTWAGTIYIDNAYLPADVRQRMIDAGVTSAPFSRYASKRDLGVGRVEPENETYSLSAGVTGRLRDWRLGAYYQYGANRQDVWVRDVVRIDRIYQALDSVRAPNGDIVCRSTLSFPENGCVATSFFGDGAVSPEARVWLLDDTAQAQELVQHVADVTIDGEPFELRGRPVSVAVGGSWRYDEYDQYGYPYRRDVFVQPAATQGYRGLPESYSTGAAPLLERSVGFDSHGKANVWELFTEAIAPLVRERTFVESLDLQAALRYANYESSGGIWAWKAGLNWIVTPEVRLRGTVSRDIREGTLSERYEVSGRAAAARDPALAGEPTYSFVGIENGNPDVAPEKADTVTVGFVYRPSWLEGFSASADYYDIRIKDAIAQLGIQTVVDSCFAGEQSLCDLIHRAESGVIISVRNTFLNVDAARTRGVDIELDYETPIAILGGDETFALRGLASIYSEASLTPFGLPRRDLVGQTGPGEGLPDYRLLLGAEYRRDGLSVNLTGSYISSGVYNINYREGVDINDNSVDAALYTHARVAYGFETLGGGWEIYFNVSNLFDEAPPIAPITGGGVFGSQQTPSDFDSVGRRYAVGVRWTY